MMAPAQSLADRFREAREAFELAQELGCTPAQAKTEMSRRRAAQARARLQAKIDGRIDNCGTQAPPNFDDAPWMMRD